MSSSQEAINAVGEVQKNFLKHWHANDLEKLLTLYHPDAVLVAKGQWAVYGHDNILKKFKEEFFKDGPPKFTLHQDTTIATEHGEMAHQKGRLEFEPNKFNAYQQVFKRDSNGHYLIYHDEFEP